MPAHRIAKYGGWAALAAGSLQVLGIVFLILFFAIELPQGPGSGLRFGYLSDVTPIYAAPINLAVIVILFLLQRKPAPVLSALAALLGTAGILITAWTNIMFVSEKITLEQQIQLFYLSFALLGPWHILINCLARRQGSLPARLTTFGIVIGAGQLIMYISTSLLGGYDEMFSLSPDEITRNIPLLISLAVGLPMALIGYLGAPIWLVLLGRALVRMDSRSLGPLDSPTEEGIAA